MMWIKKFQNPILVPKIEKKRQNQMMWFKYFQNAIVGTKIEKIVKQPRRREKNSEQSEKGGSNV